MDALALGAFLVWVATLLFAFVLGRLSRPRLEALGMSVRVHKIEVPGDDPDRFVARLLSHLPEPDLVPHIPTADRFSRHLFGPPGYASCTRTWPHDGPCAHPRMEP